MGVVVFVVIIAIAFGVVCALRSTSAPYKLGLGGLCGLYSLALVGWAVDDVS